jgi:heme oxygenase
LINIPTSERLKAFTSSSHQELEKLLVGQMRNISNQEAYSSLLQLFYNYFGAIEAQVDQLIGPAVLADYTQRRKTKSLENDIIALGGTATRSIKAEDVPQIKNILQAFGALYVMEGSTLGGPHIVRMIQKKLQTDDLKGFSFFESYGADMMHMWQQFKEILDKQATNEAEQQVILDAADETFLKFKIWILKQSTLTENLCSQQI